MQSIRFQSQINGPVFNVQNKEKLRQEIAQHTAQYQKSGGKITVLKQNEYHGPLRQFNNRKPNAKTGS